MERTIDLIAMWIDGFFIIDFQQNGELTDEIDAFVSNEMGQYDEAKARNVLDLLHNPHTDSFNTFVKRTSSSSILSSSSNAHNGRHYKKHQAASKPFYKHVLGSNSAASRKRSGSKRNSVSELNQTAMSSSSSVGVGVTMVAPVDLNSTINSTSISRRREMFSVGDYAAEAIAAQLTLIEWDNFMDIHVCHCLNSRAQGVNCDWRQPIDPAAISGEHSLFVDNYLSKSIYKMIELNYLMTHWIAAEVLMAGHAKSQSTLIGDLLRIAKHCCRLANYSSALAIYDGLQDITVRNLPAWQALPGKHVRVLEKLAALKMSFQNEPRSLYELARATSAHMPVIPPMHLFLLIVQQKEHGSFQLTNGQWKWSKLE